MTGTLDGQIALVTGGARGIGKAIAERLAGHGARVAIVDHETSGLKDAFAADVTVRAQVAEAVQSVVTRFGKITILVNNAAVGKTVPFLDITDEDWTRIISVNLTGYFIVGQEVARHMTGTGGGRIVNVASLAAHTANDGQAAYAASKAGVVALTRAMAFELAPKGILVNAVSPGPIDTDLARSMLTPATRKAREDRIPQGRLGTPHEVAAAVAFLAAPDASYVNGAVLVVDGGLLMAGIRASG